MPKRIKHKIIKPLVKFVQIESFGGILLFATTVLALIWANSPFGGFYERLWDLQLGFEIGNFKLSKPIILWINDGLMAIFFFLIGLEIKREILLGELNSLKKASLPIFAAIGGIVVPILFFFILNKDPNTSDGWGIPMATDIAFSLAILTVLGKRVPFALKIFLTAFAIVDDLVAVLAIAIFYSETINWILIFFAILPLILLMFLSIRGYYNKYIYFIFGIIVWFLFLKSGVHPTIAGILIALTIPIRQKIKISNSVGHLNTIVDNLFDESEQKQTMLTKNQIYLIDEIEDWSNKVQSPLQHLEHSLHGWVAYLIIPLFALANAGIVFNETDSLDVVLSLNLAIALILGKSVGITLFSFFSIKTGLASMPQGISFKHIIGTSFLAGVGFTMAIFIANLAFTESDALVDASKLGVLIGSVIAGLIGYFILRFVKEPAK